MRLCAVSHGLLHLPSVFEWSRSMTAGKTASVTSRGQTSHQLHCAELQTCGSWSCLSVILILLLSLFLFKSVVVTTDISPALNLLPINHTMCWKRWDLASIGCIMSMSCFVNTTSSGHHWHQLYAVNCKKYSSLLVISRKQNTLSLTVDVARRGLVCLFFLHHCRNCCVPFCWFCSRNRS